MEQSGSCHNWVVRRGVAGAVRSANTRASESEEPPDSAQGALPIPILDKIRHDGCDPFSAPL